VSHYRHPEQGCQMVFFQTKNPHLGKFWRVLQWKLLVYFMPIWYILYGHLPYFMAIWYIVLLWYVLLRKIWQPWSRKLFFLNKSFFSSFT
jgi:hypothetical protein